MIRRLTQELGMPGVLALGLGLFCLSFYAGSVAPAREALTALDRNIAKLERQLGQLTRPSIEASSQGTVASPTEEIPALIARLNALGAQRGFSVERAGVRQIDEGRLRRIEVAMPLKGTYPAIRGFLRDTAELSSTSTIDEISLRRANRADATVEAHVRLSYFFALP